MLVLLLTLISVSGLTGNQNGRIHPFSAIQASEYFNPVNLAITIITAGSDEKALAPRAFPDHFITHLRHTFLSMFRLALLLQHG
ncbi:MAG TPA: hypothetical protein DD706_01310 [Nitrospiraceae bacterium]|nr:hypothetical protein [Nitrospiraceae bacterium]